MIDTEKLKTIDAESVLSVLGLPYKRIVGRIMAHATYRGENAPSISIQERHGKWLWKDFGDETGGSWIDIVMAVNNFDYLGAIKFLNNIENSEVNIENYEKKNFSFGGQNKKSAIIEITSIAGITEGGLIDYLRSRAISFIPDWLKQINYSVIKNNKTYLNSALGIENSAGGYALRNPKIKMNIGKSAYSSFVMNAQREFVFITEGMFDGLTIAEKMRDKL